VPLCLRGKSAILVSFWTIQQNPCGSDMRSVPLEGSHTG
jgi:hypothetical protein